MNVSTILYALGAIICLACADFFLKLSSNRISNNLGTLVYALTAVVVPTAWVAWSRFSNEEFQVTREGVLSSMLVGIFFSLVVVFLSRTFASGGNLSIAVPTIRLLALVLGSALGILVLGELFTWRWALGILLTFVGIYFIITR